MLRQACVSTFKFAGLAFLGLNVRPKPAGSASTAGDLGTKIEEGVAAAAAAATAATVPLVDSIAQPTAGGTPSTSGDVRTNLQGDNPQMASPNDDNCGCAKPEEGANAAGPSVDPQAPTPPPAGGSSGDRNHVSTTKPDCKAPLVYVNCKCKKCWCTKCKCTKDAVLCCVKACGTKACGTKACGTKATNQTGGGPSQDDSVGDLGTMIKKGFAAAATVPLVDLIASPSTAGGPSHLVDSSGDVRTNSQGYNPQPQMANPIGGGSANPKDGAPGPSVDPLASIPSSAGGGSSVPESTNPKPPRVDPMDNQDKCKMCAVFYSAYRAETKASNQAVDGDGGPSKDAATTAAAGNGGDKNDRRNEESIPPQDGASRVESQVEPPPVQTTLWNDLSNVGIPGEAFTGISVFCWLLANFYS